MFNGIPWETSWGYDFGNIWEISGNPPATALFFFGGVQKKLTVSLDLKSMKGYPLVNIQKAIENGHRNSGFTQL